MRRLILVGGSAGAIEALCRLLEGLDEKLAAAVLSVIHMGEGNTNLQKVFRRHTTLQVVQPTDPQAIQSRRLYMAAPDKHLLVRAGCVLSVKGPRENRHRPSIDTLFRSAARF